MKCSERLACNGNCGDCDSLDEIVEKLAEYEDKEEQKPQTNADRIRAMSDEELADLLDKAAANCCIDHARDCRESCVDCIHDWLRQPTCGGE